MGKLIAGIDEAGRGAVVGPLVIAGVSIEPEKEAKLKALNVRDSKLIAPARRKKLAKVLERIAKDIIIVKIDACRIDTYRKEGVNLNKLEAMRMADVANYLKADRNYVDSPDVKPSRLKDFLSKLVRHKTEFIVEHKADTKYRVCGAASIMAKVSRDEEIEKLRKKYGVRGSGYPSDPRTIGWLKELKEKKKEFPDCVRRSWGTIKDLEKEENQSKLGKWFGIKRN